MENTNTASLMYSPAMMVNEPPKSKAVLWLSALIVAMLLFIVYLYFNGMDIHTNTSITK